MKIPVLSTATGLMSSIGAAFITCGTVCGGGACCVPPVLSLLGLSSYGASYVSFMAPLQPYLISITVFSLGLAFYNAYKKPKVTADCCTTGNEAQDCCTIEQPESNRFSRMLSSKGFLWAIAVCCVLMYALPHIIADNGNTTPAVKETQIVPGPAGSDTAECCSPANSCSVPCE